MTHPPTARHLLLLSLVKIMSQFRVVTLSAVCLRAESSAGNRQRFRDEQTLMTVIGEQLSSFRKTKNVYIALMMRRERYNHLRHIVNIRNFEENVRVANYYSRTN